MTPSFGLLGKRRFLPLFVTQMLGAYNDNLFRTSMNLFVVYTLYHNPAAETRFTALTTGLFTVPFFILSAMSGQLADARDKAKIIRIVKMAEILIMIAGGGGLLLAWQGIAVYTVSIPLMLAALIAMGIHSTFFGPIKYALLPQHLEPGEVLGGTGLVEAGTYLAILAGTISAGVIFIDPYHPAVPAAVAAVLVVALIGYAASRWVPPAPPLAGEHRVDFNVLRSSIQIVSTTMRVRRLSAAIIAISFFWTIGAVLFIQFTPLVKNQLTAAPMVVSLFLSIFSIGVAVGSVAINRLLKGKVSARFAAPSVLLMSAFVWGFHQISKTWPQLSGGKLYNVHQFIGLPGTPWLLLCLFCIALFGGMFVVPIYAFLTTTVKTSEAARTVAANNIVNSGAMVIGSLMAMGMTVINISAVDQLLFSSVMGIVSAWLAWRLHKACDDHDCEARAQALAPDV